MKCGDHANRPFHQARTQRTKGYRQTLARQVHEHRVAGKGAKPRWVPSADIIETAYFELVPWVQTPSQRNLP